MPEQLATLNNMTIATAPWANRYIIFMVLPLDIDQSVIVYELRMHAVTGPN
jgi:hypothetical protein